MKKWIGGLMAAGLLAGSLSASNALTLFAQVNQIGVGTPYQWDNTGAGGTFGTVPSPLNVTFQFLVPVPVIGTSIVPATLTISAVDFGPMVGTTQPLQWLSFQILATNPADWYLGNNVLLETIMPVPLPNGIEGDITGVGSIAFLSSDFLRGLVMRSDYINISQTQNQTATWSFSSVNPTPLVAGAGGYLRDTLFGGNGNFSATFRNIVPEPG
ncbi:MAG: hypothetical protein NZ557_00825, partial [Chthonomonadaceae bacterium]|nr:hypothetical protein [Chthonomonadaceae bacterium]